MLINSKFEANTQKIRLKQLDLQILLFLKLLTQYMKRIR